MVAKRKSVVMNERELLHVETPLGIVNIRTGLSDTQGRRVDSVEIIPNGYVGEPAVELDGYSNSRLIEELGGDGGPFDTERGKHEVGEEAPA